MGDVMILNFDESGNLGKKGRYFTIACIGGSDLKPLKNTMKKAILKVKKQFPQFENAKEIKASESFPIIKDYMLRKIATKDIDIRYIVADLDNVKQALKDDENLLYNYLLHFLVKSVALEKGVKDIEINIDKRTIKVQSINTFEGYIKLKLIYELGKDLDIKVKYIESHNSYAIQATDFVANAINTFYEYRYDYYYNLIKHKIVHIEHFPYKYFGQDKIVNIRL